MQSNWLNSALSPVVYGDIVLSINTQYNNREITESSRFLLEQICVLHIKCIASPLTIFLEFKRSSHNHNCWLGMMAVYVLHNNPVSCHTCIWKCKYETYTGRCYKVK